MLESDKVIQRKRATFAQNLIEDIEGDRSISPTIKKALLKLPKTRKIQKCPQY